MSPLTTDDERRTHPGAYHQRLVIFFVVVFAFSLVSIRTEYQQHRINEQQRQITATNLHIAQSQYRECLARNTSARNINKILDALVVAVKTSPQLPATERQRRVLFYESVRSEVVDCGKDPSKP